ncbi:Hsp70 family protein [Corynebacterium sp. H128]|uniref:Hsp70 family protein n=1 Tax=unclassified Corynebacterium TaxID=2624378 RepID=UPI0030B44A76
MSTAWHFALDFGTSNTSAAHTAPMSGSVETVALTHRSNLMPSAVYLEDGAVLAGDTALLRGRRDASKLLLSPKRYIDHDHVQLGGHDEDTLKLIAAVIATALDRARSQHAGQDPETVTLTHPEAWSVHSVDQLKNAAQQAGVRAEIIRTISEPRAAAVHYAAQQQVKPGSHVAVFDFGGGTLDIAVLEALNDGNFRVVSAKGDNSLGGRTVDNLMFRWVITQLEHDDPDFADYVRTAPVSVMHSLEEAIREAKEILSDTSSATITVSTPQGERDILITRDEFNGIIQDSVGRGVELTRAALEQAGVDQATTPIYMTGGSSRIPYVQNRLGEIGTVMTLDDPKTVVSRGALRATLNGFTEGSAATAKTPIAPAAGAAGAGALAGGANPYGNAAPNSAPASPQGAAAPTGNPYGANPYGGGADNAGQPAANAFSQSPSAGGSGNNNVPSSAYSTTAGGASGSKSKAPLLIGGGVLALALVGGGIWALTNGGSEDPSPASTETQAASPSTQKSTTTSKSSGSGSSSKTNDALADPSKNERHIVNRESSTKDVLPAAFVDKIRSCNDPRDIGSSVGWFADSPATGYACLVETSALGDKQNESAYSGVKYVLVGDEAQKGWDAVQKSSKMPPQKLQDASGNKPEVVTGLTSDSDTSPEWAAWYPDQKILVASHTGTNYKGKETEYLKYWGFLQ